MVHNCGRKKFITEFIEGDPNLFLYRYDRCSLKFPPFDAILYEIIFFMSMKPLKLLLKSDIQPFNYAHRQFTHLFYTITQQIFTLPKNWILVFSMGIFTHLVQNWFTECVHSARIYVESWLMKWEKFYSYVWDYRDRNVKNSSGSQSAIFFAIF